MRVKVFRYDPLRDKKPWYQEFKVDIKERGMKVLGVLDYLNTELGAGIAYRSSCRSGQCGSCAIMINNRPGLACRTPARDRMVLEPLKNFPVIRDLVVSHKSTRERMARLRPFLHRGTQRFTGEIEPISLRKTKFKELKDCIECYSCLGGCPVKESDDNYAGPTLMRLIARFELDPRDGADRLAMAVEEGLYKCTTCGKCTVVCPEGFRIHEDVIE
ncbi:MAG: 4Fe-4S dicluster domain-containing protein [Acidobacteria bacterium]|nr:4Fe-4S dicluster domain-containing protein [Acidobacteriota bacterium]